MTDGKLKGLADLETFLLLLRTGSVAEVILFGELEVKLQGWQLVLVVRQAGSEFQMHESLNTSLIKARLEIREADAYDEHTSVKGFFSGHTIALPSASETKSLKFETDYTVSMSITLPQEPHNGGYYATGEAIPVTYFR